MCVALAGRWHQHEAFVIRGISPRACIDLVRLSRQNCAGSTTKSDPSAPQQDCMSIIPLTGNRQGLKKKKKKRLTVFLSPNQVLEKEGYNLNWEFECCKCGSSTVNKQISLAIHFVHSTNSVQWHTFWMYTHIYTDQPVSGCEDIWGLGWTSAGDLDSFLTNKLYFVHHWKNRNVCHKDCCLLSRFRTAMPRVRNRLNVCMLTCFFFLES